MAVNSCTRIHYSELCYLTDPTLQKCNEHIRSDGTITDSKLTIGNSTSQPSHTCYYIHRIALQFVEP